MIITDNTIQLEGQQWRLIKEVDIGSAEGLDYLITGACIARPTEGEYWVSQEIIDGLRHKQRPHFNGPLVEELNELTASQVCLLLLRCLRTSDLSHMYMLFKPETLLDIEEECSLLLAQEIQSNESDSGLSPEEITEYNDHLQTIYAYAKQESER